MPNLMTLSVSVKPVVRKYLRFHYGESDSIFLRRKSPVAKMILNHLEIAPFRQAVVNRYENEMRFVMSEEYVKGRDPRVHSVYIPEKSVIMINSYIDKILKRELFSFLDGYLIHGTEIRLGILEFMRRYNISEDDISFDGLKKAYYRHRMSSNILKAC